MKLNSTLVERTLSQFDAQAIPDDHPVVPQLNNLFGEHTFFVDNNGLNIVEPEGEGNEGHVVKIASWDESSPRTLAPHEPELTDVVIQFERSH